MKRLIIGDVTTDSCKLRLGWKWFSVHLAKNTRQRIRYNVKFSRNVFDGEIVVLKTNCPRGEHIGRVLHVVQVRESLVVGTKLCNRGTALATNSLSFCTMSTSSRFCEDTWKSRGLGARYGLSLGMFGQIDARAGSSGNGSSSTSPNNRDSASGTTFNFPATWLTVKAKFCNAIAQRVSTLDVSCMLYRWVNA